jgi:putative ABC transport system substrate-binding protein
MRRRSFLTLFGGSAAAWPIAARAQQSRVPKISMLLQWREGNPDGSGRVREFRQELRRLGWVDGRNALFDEHWVADDMVRIRAYAADLINSKPDVIVLTAARMVPPLLQANKTIPMVFVQVSDPVGAGFVPSLARPGGNLTGFSGMEYTVIGKLVDILKQIAPGLQRVAHLFNPDNPSSGNYFRAVEAAASALAITALAAQVRDVADIERALAGFAGGDTGILLSPDATTLLNRDLIIELTARHKLPAIYSGTGFVGAGGLASYGPNAENIYRRSADYVDRILKGESPADLPVQQPIKYELMINMKTARALGLTVPLALQVAADEVIE